MNNKKYEKILIIREGAIGDVVHTSNIFRSIKKYSPNTQIDYITSPAPASLLVNDSRLQNIHILEGKNYKYLTKLGLKLRKERYDLIINLQPSLRFRYLSFIIGGKETVIYQKTYKMHAVENFFHTAKNKIDALINPDDIELEIPQKIIDEVKTKIPVDKKIVILNTQTSLTRRGRKWNFESFKKLAFLILEKYDCNILITGSKADVDEVKVYENLHPNIHVIAGKFSLLESAAIYSLASVLVSGDTGPLHIATATKNPTCIGLYGAASPSRTGPWGKKHFIVQSDLPCVPCDLRNCKLKDEKDKLINPCMSSIKPEKILAIIEENNLL